MTPQAASPRDFHCSFCGAARLAVPKLIAGPRVFICSPCAIACHALVAAAPARPRGLSPRPATPLEHRPRGPTVPEDFAETGRGAASHCSFCGRREQDVAAVVHGTVARICSDCVDLCLDILTAEGLGPRAKAPPSPDG